MHTALLTLPEDHVNPRDASRLTLPLEAWLRSMTVTVSLEGV